MREFLVTTSTKAVEPDVMSFHLFLRQSLGPYILFTHKYVFIPEIWGSNGGEGVDRGLLVWDAVWCYGRELHLEYRGDTPLQNVSDHLQDYTASQPTTPRSTSFRSASLTVFSFHTGVIWDTSQPCETGESIGGPRAFRVLFFSL
jgi:hypothetical protein